MIHNRSSSARGCALAIALGLFLGGTAGASAQGFTEANHGSPQTLAQAASRQPTPAPTPVTKPATQPLPSQEQCLYLVRATLMTLNDANRSGNYTVLRDLAAPDFQAKNTAADLSQSFSDLRRRNFDLFAAALLTPAFTFGPALDANDRLHLTGYFPTRPLQINFELIFQVVGGQWRLFGISVSTPGRAQSQLATPPGQPASRPFYGLRVFSGTVGWRW